MKRIAILLLMILMAACTPQVIQPITAPAPTPTPQPVPSDAWVILNGMVITGAKELPIIDGVVVIQGDRILAVGQQKDFDISPEVRVIDARGGTILPGIFDAHVHQGSPAITRRGFLMSGVSSICDTGTSIPLMPQYDVESDTTGLAARGFKSGPMLTAVDALPGEGGGFSWSIEISTPDQGRAAVDELVQNGADYIKVALDPGDLAYPRAVLTPKILKAIVDEAHAKGKLVRAHARYPEMINLALDAGVDGIEHVPIPADYDPNAVIPGKEDITLPTDLEQALERMVQQGVTLTPTLDALAGDIFVLKDPTPSQQTQLRYLLAVVRRFHALGGIIAVGNDYGTNNVVRGMPIREMNMLQAAGLTPMQVIIAATHNAATICGHGNELGTLEPGKLADVLIIASSPYSSLNAFQKVYMVIRGGMVVYPIDFNPHSRP